MNKCLFIFLLIFFTACNGSNSDSLNKNKNSNIGHPAPGPNPEDNEAAYEQVANQHIKEMKKLIPQSLHISNEDIEIWKSEKLISDEEAAELRGSL